MDVDVMAGLQTVAGYLDTLRFSRVQAGKPSYKDLSRRSGFPPSTLFDALKPGRTTLPRLDTVRALAAAIGLPDERVQQLEEAWYLHESGSFGVAASTVPRQLPSDVPDFTGREQALIEIDRALDCHGRHVVAICGTGGVGKTSLAVHWAHRHAEDYPDGQLYLNLRGYDSTPASRPARLCAACYAAWRRTERRSVTTKPNWRTATGR